VHEHGLNYSRFKRLLTLAQIKLDRKQLAKMSASDPERFSRLIEKVKNP
jgi:ribosomal protein L20